VASAFWIDADVGAQNLINASPLYVYSFDRSHGEEQVFDQEGLLNVDWERAEVLRALFDSPTGLRLVDEARILGGDIVVIQVGSLE